MIERFIVLVGAGLHHNDADLIVSSATADIYIGPPPISITLKREEPTIPDIDFRLPKEPKARDWEQRQRKPRRR